MKKLLLILPLLFLSFPQMSHAALTTNLSSYWKLEGNSNDSVASNNGTDTSISYGTAYGKITQGALVNNPLSGALTSYITVADNTSLNPGTGDFTYAAWVKTSQTGKFMAIIWHYGSNTNNLYYLVLDASGHASFYMRDTGGVNTITFTDNVDLRDGAWHYLVVTKAGSTTGTLYVDGSSKGTGTNGSALNVDTTGASLFFGQQAGADAAGGWTGDIDEIGIWQRALSSTEVTQLYNSGTGCQYAFLFPTNPKCLASATVAPTSIISLVRSFWF